MSETKPVLIIEAEHHFQSIMETVALHYFKEISLVNSVDKGKSKLEDQEFDTIIIGDQAGAAELVAELVKTNPLATILFFTNQQYLTLENLTAVKTAPHKQLELPGAIMSLLAD